jgi:hypothetical protein
LVKRKTEFRKRHSYSALIDLLPKRVPKNE